MMRHHTFDEQTVDQFNHTFADHTDVLNHRNISATNRVSLANAAAGSSVSTDELLAVMNYRIRRSARHQAATHSDEAAFTHSR